MFINLNNRYHINAQTIMYIESLAHAYVMHFVDGSVLTINKNPLDVSETSDKDLRAWLKIQASAEAQRAPLYPSEVLVPDNGGNE